MMLAGIFAVHGVNLTLADLVYTMRMLAEKLTRKPTKKFLVNNLFVVTNALNVVRILPVSALMKLSVEVTTPLVADRVFECVLLPTVRRIQVAFGTVLVLVPVLRHVRSLITLAVLPHLTSVQALQLLILSWGHRPPSEALVMILPFGMTL